MTLHWAFRTLILPLVLITTVGCGATCDRDSGEPPIEYADGTTANGVYMSSDWSGPLLSFPAGVTYRFLHGLGASPRVINVYLSYDPDGVVSGNVAPGAGNQGVIEDVTDEYIDVRNDTCTDRAYLLVTAYLPAMSEVHASSDVAD